MSILLSDVVLPIVATVQTYLLDGHINLWFGPRVAIQAIVARFVEMALSDWLNDMGLMDNSSNRGVKRGFVLFVIALVYACLFDDQKMRMDLWTSMTTVQLSLTASTVADWIAMKTNIESNFIRIEK